ncbi:hypothetical protein M9458_051617, partial [Cirrhinus mrigala]
SMTATANSVVNRPVFMPETFTGSGRDWADWSQQFEMAADVNNWSGDLKLKFICILWLDSRRPQRRLPGESAREFGNALRRLVAKSYPVANGETQDLLAREHFIAHVGTGELRIQLRSARPTTLEAAINLAFELELIR